MEQSQLVELVKSLNQDERNELRDFVNLAFVCQGKLKPFVVSLLDVLILRVSKEGAKLDKGTVYRLVFSEQGFVTGKLEKVMVEAHKAVRGYLLCRDYLNPRNGLELEFDFSKILKRRGLLNRFEGQLTKIRRDLQDINPKGFSYYFNNYLIEREVFVFESLKNLTKGDLNVPLALKALDLFYYINKFEYLCLFLLQKKAASIEAPNLIEHALRHLDIPPEYLEEEPILRIYSKIFGILNKDSQEVEDVRELFELLQKHSNDLDKENQIMFYTYLRNFCVLVSTAHFDNEEIRAVLFDLYKDNLPRGFLHYEGKLHPNTFLAVTFAGLRVNAFEWTRDFIQTYKADLFEDNESNDYYRLNYAYYLFATKQFSESYDWIPSSFNNTQYLLRAKRLELMTLYELQSELLTFKLDAFKMFVSRTSSKLLSKKLRQVNSDFINLLHQIVYSTPGDAKRSELLVKRVHERKQAAEWRWLLEKAQELRHR